MIRLVSLGLFALCLAMTSANASPCTTLPVTLANNTSADATQVMANFAYLLGCVNSAAPPGGPAGGDLSGSYPNPNVVTTHLPTPLPLVQGGTGNATGQPSGSAGGDLTGTYPNPTLAASGATAGMYTDPSISVNSKGLITSVANGTIGVLQSGTLSNVAEASIDFNSTVLAYNTVEITVTYLSCSTSGSAVKIRTRYSGSDIIGSAYQWAYTRTYSGSGTVGASASDTSIQLAANLVNSDEGFGTVRMMRGGPYTKIMYKWNGMNSSNLLENIDGGSSVSATGGPTGISFYASSGTISLTYQIKAY